MVARAMQPGEQRHRAEPNRPDEKQDLEDEHPFLSSQKWEGGFLGS
jgi:hypothetical protein